MYVFSVLFVRNCFHDLTPATVARFIRVNGDYRAVSAQRRSRHFRANMFPFFSPSTVLYITRNRLSIRQITNDCTREQFVFFVRPKIQLVQGCISHVYNPRNVFYIIVRIHRTQMSNKNRTELCTFFFSRKSDVRFVN